MMLSNSSCGINPLERPIRSRGQKVHAAWQWLVVSTRTVCGKLRRYRLIASAISRDAIEPAKVSPSIATPLTDCAHVDTLHGLPANKRGGILGATSIMVQVKADDASIAISRIKTTSCACL